MKITRTDLIILALLSEKPSHGWEIDTTLTAIGADHWAEYSRPHLYYSLRKLERNGYIELLPTGSREAKKTYKITEKGERTLADDQITAGFAYNPTYSDFDLLLGFPQHFGSGSKKLKDQLQARQKALEQELASIQRVWQEAELTGAISFGRFAVIKHRIKFLKSELDFLKWLDKNTPDDWKSLTEPSGG